MKDNLAVRHLLAQVYATQSHRILYVSLLYTLQCTRKPKHENQKRVKNSEKLLQIYCDDILYH